MHLAGHASRHLPLCDCARIEKGSINDRAGCFNMASCPGRTHRETLKTWETNLRSSATLGKSAACVGTVGWQCIQPVNAGPADPHCASVCTSVRRGASASSHSVEI